MDQHSPESSLANQDQGNQYGAQIGSQAYRTFLESFEKKSALFMLRAKVDTYTQGSQTDENRVRYHISRVQVLDPIQQKAAFDTEIRNENQYLLDKLKIYSHQY